MPHPLDRADLRTRVQTRLDTELDRWTDELAEIGPDVTDLIDPVRTLLEAGDFGAAAEALDAYLTRSEKEVLQAMSAAAG